MYIAMVRASAYYVRCHILREALHIVRSIVKGNSRASVSGSGK